MVVARKLVEVTGIAVVIVILSYEVMGRPSKLEQKASAVETASSALMIAVTLPHPGARAARPAGIAVVRAEAARSRMTGVDSIVGDICEWLMAKECRAVD